MTSGNNFATDANAARPPLSRGRHVAAEVVTRVALPISLFDEWFKAVELEDILPGHGSIPRIVRSELVSGVWSDPGARRRVFMADGSSVLEEVLEQKRPAYFSYMVWDFTPPLGLLAQYARGEFFITRATGAETDVRWVYSFRPRSPIFVPPLQSIVKGAFRPFMEVCIETIRSVSEEHARREVVTDIDAGALSSG